MSICDCVDGDLLVIKAIFFLYFAGNACIHPYISVYMKQLGLLPSQIGVIKSGGDLMSVILKPVIGSIADKTGRPKMVAVLTVTLASALHFSMLFFPAVPVSTAASQATVQQRHLAEPVKSDTQSWFSLTFWLFFWIIFISHGAQWSSVSQVEAATYQIIKKNQRGEFGRQRVFGSVGYAIFALLSGVAMDTFTEQTSPAESPGNKTSPDIPGNKSDYSVAFYMFLSFMVLSVTCLLFLKDWSTTRPATGYMKAMGKLLSQLHLIIVLFVVLLVGACDGAGETYLFLHLKNLGASQTVLGSYLFVKNVSEVPFYVISGWIIRKLGHATAIGFSFIPLGVRFLLYSFVSDPWWIVGVDTINGYHAVTWAAATSYASISAGDDLQAFAQGLVATTFYGLGHSLGNLVGGPVFQRYGAVVFFRSFTVSCLVGFLLYFLLYRCFAKKDDPTVRHPDIGEDNETKSPLVPAVDVAESESLRPGAFLRGGSVTNRAGEDIGFLRLIKPQQD
ncbi:MFSD6 [Branchiostoma lanceolatum]|uniref:MFSD6 protein n=2 Tax=Branchiostoma lanceolatum TaxID=7740 RepID=A0A8K0A6A9_BRALA|nr:MFSD6 [Branchiostoma lanceolatum]